MATINHKTYNEGTETFKDFSVYDGKDTLIFKVDGSEGNVGIGTATANNKLTVYALAGVATTLANSVTNSAVYINADTDNGSNNLRIGESGSGGYFIQVSNSAGLTAYPINLNPFGGNVGIGTVSPDNGVLTIVKNTSNATESTYGIAIQSFTTNAYTELLLGADDTVDAGIIQTAAKGTSFTTKKLAINPNGGNVGIGTTSPSTALTVNGVIQTTLGSGGITLGGNATPDKGYIGYNYYNLSGTEVVAQDIRNSWRVMFGNGADKGMTFDYRAPSAAAGIFTEYVRIQPTGGISFNGDTLAANALDDYEEGTWTPTDQSGAGLTFVAASGNYTKIGREVSYRAVIVYPSTADVNLVEIGGLPFTVPNNNQSRGGYVTYSTTSALSYAITVSNTTKVGLTDNTGTSLTNVQLTGATIFIGGSYNV